jgi:hypothetical protein
LEIGAWCLEIAMNHGLILAFFTRFVILDKMRKKEHSKILLFNNSRFIAPAPRGSGVWRESMVKPPPVAEIWLIASDDESRLSALWMDLTQSNSQLTVWRAKHGQISLMPIAALADAVVEALATRSASVHVYVDMTDGLDQLMRAVKPADEHRVTACLWPRDATPALLKALNRPDAWVILAWLRNDGLSGIIVPLTSLDGDSNSTTEHQEALKQWAQALSREELAKLTGWYRE